MASELTHQSVVGTDRLALCMQHGLVKLSQAERFNKAIHIDTGVFELTNTNPILSGCVG